MCISKINNFCLLLSVFLIGCETVPRNIQVVCEVGEGKQVIQVITYEYDTYHWNPHVSGHFESLGAVYKRNKKSIYETWLLSKISSDTEFIANSICSQSKIINGTAILSPAPLSMYIDGNIHWDTGEIEQDDLNVFLLKPKKKKFIIKSTPANGSPYLVNDKGDKLSRSNWVNRSVNYKNDVLTVTQVDFLKKPFDAYYDSGDYTTPFRYLEGRGTGCPECKPVIIREMVSHDNGRSWLLGSYKVIDSNKLPDNAVLKVAVSDE